MSTSDLTTHLKNYDELCIQLATTKHDMIECREEEKIFRDECMKTLMETKEFERLRYYRTLDGKKYLNSFDPKIKNEITVEINTLENKINGMMETNVNKLFVHRKLRYIELETLYNTLSKNRKDILSKIHKYGKFDVIVDRKRYTQTINKKKGTITKKNFITAFVGDQPHNKWKSLKEFENDWKQFFGQDKYSLSCTSVTESRKRNREDDGDDGDDKR